MKLIVGFFLLACVFAQECEPLCGACLPDDLTKCQYCPQWSSFNPATEHCTPLQREDTISAPTYRIPMQSSYAGGDEAAFRSELAEHFPPPASLASRSLARTADDFFILDMELSISDANYIWFIAYPRLDVGETVEDMREIVANVSAALNTSAWRDEALGSKFAVGAVFTEGEQQSTFFCDGTFQRQVCAPLPVNVPDVPFHEGGGLPAVVILFVTMSMTIWFWCSWSSRNQRWDAMDRVAAEKFQIEHPEDDEWEEYDHMWEQKIPHTVEPTTDEII